MLALTKRQSEVSSDAGCLVVWHWPVCCIPELLWKKKSGRKIIRIHQSVLCYGIAFPWRRHKEKRFSLRSMTIDVSNIHFEPAENLEFDAQTTIKSGFCATNILPYLWNNSCEENVSCHDNRILVQNAELWKIPKVFLSCIFTSTL